MLVGVAGCLGRALGDGSESIFEMTPPQDPGRSGGSTQPSVLIAELHAAGYSNAKIGYLLAQHGLPEAISEATVRRWAMRDGDPRLSQWNALRSLHAAAIAIVKFDEVSQAGK